MERTARYYKNNPEAKIKHRKSSAKANRKPSAVKKRVESNRKQREAKKAGKNVKGKDYDHAVGKFVSVKTNRGRTRNGKRV